MKSYFGMSLFAVIGVVVLVVIINSSMQSALTGPAGDMSEAAIAERVAAAGKLNTGAAIVPETPAPAAPAAPAAPRSGEAVYKSACFACHGTGAAGAPKLGDAAAWGPRAATGIDALMNSAINGKNAMPPRGTCGSCSDDELKGAIEYMLSQSK